MHTRTAQRQAAPQGMFHSTSLALQVQNETANRDVLFHAWSRLLMPRHTAIFAHDWVLFHSRFRRIGLLFPYSATSFLFLRRTPFPSFSPPHLQPQFSGNLST
jgi:hypothetical protein